MVCKFLSEKQPPDAQHAAQQAHAAGKQLMR